MTQQQTYSFQKNIQKVQPQGWLLFLVILLAWQVFVSYPRKMESIIMSLTYSFIEWSWYTFTKEINGHIIIVPLAEKGRKGFTSVEQCVANTLYLPLAMHGYLLIFSLDGIDPCSFPYFGIICLRILFFPFNIWLLEIVQDRVMKFMMGMNPAWDYSNAKGGMFDGAINLHHWKLWIVLGLIASTFNLPAGLAFVWIFFSTVHFLKYRAQLDTLKPAVAPTVKVD